METEKKTLSQVLQDAETFVANHHQQPKLVVENTILPALRTLAFQAAAATDADPQTQTRYLQAAENLRDICVTIGHPNTLKEDPLYRRIKMQFPNFANPLRP